MVGSEKAAVPEGGESINDNHISDLDNQRLEVPFLKGWNTREGAGLSLGQVVFKGPESHLNGDVQDQLAVWVCSSGGRGGAVPVGTTCTPMGVDAKRQGWVALGGCAEGSDQGPG